jgi:4-hydroxybenzoate polyprenyltransferase
MPRSKPKLIFKCMRPYQWVKNALIFLPLILAHQMSDWNRVVAACLAFTAFCLGASAGYVFNDLLDREADRHHVRKSTRPFASGELSPGIGVVLVFLLAGGSLAISLICLPRLFTALLVLYLILTLGYSMVLKSRLLVDVISLASLYTLRVVAGAFAVQVELTVWLLAFSTFFFLSLAFVKRYVELNMLRDAGEDATMRRRGYMVQDIDIIESVGPTSGYMAVLVLSLYINDQVAKRLYLPDPAILDHAGLVFRQAQGASR